jgi:hypothetical protein
MNKTLLEKCKQAQHRHLAEKGSQEGSQALLASRLALLQWQMGLRASDGNSNTTLGFQPALPV